MNIYVWDLHKTQKLREHTWLFAQAGQTDSLKAQHEAFTKEVA